ncbi:MAG: cytochrome c [Alphaproteobacteria bacterium]
MPMTLFKTLGLAGALFSALMIAAPTAGMADVEDTVKKRQANMKDLGRSMKTIKDYLGGSGSAADVQAAAMTMAAIAPTLADLFPEGSSMDEVSIESEALPSIWEDWNGFTNLFGTLETESRKLADLAASGADSDQIAAQFGATGKGACGACHKDFRKDK